MKIYRINDCKDDKHLPVRSPFVLKVDVMNDGVKNESESASRQIRNEHEHGAIVNMD